MYRITDIQNKLFSLVGWRQDYDPAKQIDTALTKSESGLFFQGEHPMMTLDNLRNIMPETFVMQYPTWDATVNYNKGDKAKDAAGKLWRSKQDANTGHVQEAGDWWEAYDAFSDYLTDITNDGIAAAVQKFANDKLNRGEGKNLLDRRVFFDGAGRIKDVINNTASLVGYELVPARAMGVTMKIERIALQMIGAPGVVRVYLFHSSETEPQKTWDFTVQGNGSVEWFPVEKTYLPYISENTGAGGSWYLVYDQNALPLGMEAINVSKDWSSEPCGSCNSGNLQAWRELTKYLQILPFKVTPPEDFDTVPQLWDIGQAVKTCTLCYGINVETTIGCDLTDFIVSQRDAFKSVIAKQVTVSAMRLMAMNPSVLVNRYAKNASRNDLLYELDGNPASGLYGIGAALKDAYKALYVDTSGIDRICLPCNTHGVRYRSV